MNDLGVSDLPPGLESLARRHRKRLSWRVLTVAQDSQVCAQDVAFAVRVSWGRDDTLVIYRNRSARGLERIADSDRAMYARVTRTIRLPE